MWSASPAHRKSTTACVLGEAAGMSSPRSQLKTVSLFLSRAIQSFEIRLSPSSHSGFSACSGKTKASNRYPAIVPETHVPLPEAPAAYFGDLQVVCPGRIRRRRSCWPSSFLRGLVCAAFASADTHEP